MKRNVLKLLIFTLVVIQTLVGCGNNSNVVRTEGTNSNENTIMKSNDEEKSNSYIFDTPEDAINNYIDGINEKNVEKAMQSWVEAKRKGDIYNDASKYINEIKSIEVSNITYNDSYTKAYEKDFGENNVKGYLAEYHINYKTGSSRASHYSKDSYKLNFVVINENNDEGWKLYNGIIEF